MKVVQAVAEVWRPQEELQPWEDPNDLPQSQLEPVHLPVSIRADKVVYLLKSFRDNRCLVIMDEGIQLTLVGDITELTVSFYG